MSWSDAIGGQRERAPARVVRDSSVSRRAGSGYVGTAVEREVAAVAQAPEGQRNDTLNTASFNLGQLVGGGELDEGQAREVLFGAGLEAGLNESETRKTIASGLQAGKAQPRRVPEPTPKRRQEATAPEAVTDSRIVWNGAVEIFRPLPPMRWLVEALDMAPGAPALFAGYGFSGKTAAAQALAVAVAAGLEGWGTFKVRPGRVRHFDYEQGGRLTNERYQRLAAGATVGPADLAGLECVSFPPIYFDAPDAEERLVRELDGVDLAIVDSFRAAAPGVDENSSDARRPLDMLTRVSERTGCVPLVIHHARKPSKDGVGGAKMAIRGSGALFDACSTVLVFDGAKGKATRVSHEKARNSGRLADDFLLKIGDVEVDGNLRGGLSVIAESVSQSTAPSNGSRLLDEMKLRILAFMREHGSAAGKNALSKRIGGDRSTFYAAVAELVESGELANVGTYHKPLLRLGLVTPNV